MGVASSLGPVTAGKHAICHACITQKKKLNMPIGNSAVQALLAVFSVTQMN